MSPYRLAPAVIRLSWFRAFWHRIEHRFGWQKGTPITWQEDHQNCDPSWMCPGPLCDDEEVFMTGFKCETCGVISNVTLVNTSEPKLAAKWLDDLRIIHNHIDEIDAIMHIHLDLCSAGLQESICMSEQMKSKQNGKST